MQDYKTNLQVEVKGMGRERKEVTRKKKKNEQIITFTTTDLGLP